MNTLVRKLSALTLISAISLSSFATSNVAFASTDLKVGSIFKISGVNTSKNASILQILKSDLNKDKKTETLYLLGEKASKDSLYYDHLTYVIKDGKSGKYLVKALKDDENYDLAGYYPQVQVTDLNADGQSDLFLSAPTGGSGGYIRYDLSTMKNGKLVTFLSDKDTAGIDVTGKFLDNYQAQFTSKTLNKTWTIDVSDSKKVYQDIVYDKNGKHIGTSEPYSGSITNFEIVDLYGKKMLKGYQDIKGTCEADTMAILEIYMVYEKNQWRIVGVEQTTVLKSFE